MMTSHQTDEIQKWKQAEQGDVVAQNFLGDLYEMGVGVLKDYEEAFRWYQKSARLGDPGGQLKLAEFYQEGKGVEPDVVQAYIWLNIAAVKGIASIVAQRDSVEETMTSDQIKRAQRLAKRWIEEGDTPEPADTSDGQSERSSTSSHTPAEHELISSSTREVTSPIQREGWQPSGSGFYLKGTSHILTNLHVVGTADEIRVSFSSGEKYIGKIIARDANNDVAIIALMGISPRDGGFHVNLDVELDPGMEVHAIGFPLNSGIGIVSGKVVSCTDINENVTKFTMTAPINEGNSGGPVIDENGNLIGIAQGGLVHRGAESIRFATKISTTIHALKAAKLTRQFSVHVAGSDRRFSSREIFKKFSPYVVQIDVK